MTYKKGLKAIQNDQRLATELADLYEKQKKYSEAVKLYESVLENNPDNELAINNLASILTQHIGDEKSLAHAMKLAKRFEYSDQPVYIDTLGWIYYKTGDAKKASDLLSRAVELAPKVPHFNYHLGMALFKLGDPRTKVYLSNALQSDLKFPGRENAVKTLALLQKAG